MTVIPNRIKELNKRLKTLTKPKGDLCGVATIDYRDDGQITYEVVKNGHGEFVDQAGFEKYKQMYEEIEDSQLYIIQMRPYQSIADSKTCL